MCWSTAAKITFNLYVTQPGCSVCCEMQKCAFCSWVQDRELTTCPASEPAVPVPLATRPPSPALPPVLIK